MNSFNELLQRPRKGVQDLSQSSEKLGRGKESAEGELILKHTTYFGCLIGIIPVLPKSIKEYKIRSRHFLLYCIFSVLYVAIVCNLKSHTLQLIGKTHYKTYTDKLNNYLAETASLLSDIGIRTGFLVRTAECVLLFKGIQDYVVEYSPPVGKIISHKIIKYGSLVFLNIIYLTFMGGLTLRKLKSTYRTNQSWENVTFTFFPTDEATGNLFVSDIICHISSFLSSYYLMVLVISISYILLDFLGDFKQKLELDIQLQGREEKFNGLSTSESNISQISDRLLHPIIEEKDRSLRSDLYSSFESKMNANQRQFTCLTTLFRRFNRALGPSLVVSFFADLMTIVTIFYSLTSSALEAEVEIMANNESIPTAGIFTNDNSIIAAAEAEYEARVWIIAAIGSYLVYKINTYKTELEELLYACDNPAKLLSTTPAGTLYGRFKEWTWSLDGMDIFSINFRLLASMLGTVTSYVIVLLQVNMSEKAESQNRLVQKS